MRNILKLVLSQLRNCLFVYTGSDSPFSWSVRAAASFSETKNISFIYKNNNVWMSGIKKTMALKMIQVGHHTELYSGDDILCSIC